MEEKSIDNKLNQGPVINLITGTMETNDEIEHRDMKKLYQNTLTKDKETQVINKREAAFFCFIFVVGDNSGTDDENKTRNDCPIIEEIIHCRHNQRNMDKYLENNMEEIVNDLPKKYVI